MRRTLHVSTNAHAGHLFIRGAGTLDVLNYVSEVVNKPTEEILDVCEVVYHDFVFIAKQTDDAHKHEEKSCGCRRWSTCRMNQTMH